MGASDTAAVAPHATVAVPGERRETRYPSRLRLLAWLLLYAIAVVYSSLVLGPMGFNYMPRDPVAVWHWFLATPYVENGSDQRPDWIANLLNLIPLGFLTTAVLWPNRWRWLRPFAAIVALAFGITFVLAVKYAQLFFPPRTVTLNYIIAQSLGVTAGVVLLWLWRSWLQRFVARRFAGSGLGIVLTAYTIALVAYSLLPFDIVLSAGDLHQRLADLPAKLMAMPGAGRPTGIRIVLVAMSAVSTVPIGMLFALRWPKRSVARLTFAGLMLMVAITLAQTAMISATPYLLALAYRTLGVALGVVLLRALRARDPVRLRAALGRLVPAMVLPYIAAVLFVSGLLTRGWRTVPEAIVAVDRRGLLPFWHWYIVTKEHAAQSLVLHLVTFAPIGVMIWLRRGRTAGGAWLAGVLGGLFSLAMEVGRQFKPELQADFNDVLVGAVAAVLAYRCMPWVWRLFEEAIWPAPAPSVREAVPERRVTVIGVFVSAACAGLTAAAVIRYPLGPWWLAGGLLLYAALLLRWPLLWLIAVPLALPCFDLSPWTGWLLVGESDLVVLVTISVLLLRDPPARGEWWPPGFAGVVLAFAAAVTVIGIAMGVTSPVQEPGGTSNIYLAPWNALRVAKGFGLALAVLPFLIRAVAAGKVAWFGYGMIAGLLGVTAAVVAERLAFAGLLDFASDYRVAGPFGSMHIGGGHIGTYLAIALPFVITPLIRPRAVGALAALMAAAAGGYALVVTYARTGYAAAALGIGVVALLWPIASMRRGVRWLAALVPVPLLLALAAIVVGAASETQFMASRFTTLVPDFEIRVGNWKAGLAARDPGWGDTLFGTGLGTYPRLAATRISGRAVPSSFVLGRDRDSQYVSFLVRSADYFGQKLSIPPGGDLHLTLAVRPRGGPTTVVAFLCAKWLLYSADCVSMPLTASAADQWNQVSADFGAQALEGLRRSGIVPRPVELSFGFPHGQTVDISDVSLRDGAGNELIANGDFTDGTARWLFTDDDHIAWRIMDLYLLVFFESGAVGLAAFLALVAVSLAGGLAAIRSGEALGAAVVASLLAFLAAGVMDGLEDAPRLMSVFFLVVLAGMLVRVAPGVAGPNEKTSPERGQ
jgi:VanZ family protein